MAHSLPPRPSFVPTPPEPSISAALEADLDLLAGPSTSTPSTDCAICASPPKYTCPKCSRRTCSLACSKSHKEKYSCDGTRDTTAFVPLKEVSEGVWSDDYKWLEESRRKVASWGEALPPGSAAHLAPARGGGRVRPNKRRRQTGGGALGMLQQELEKRGIEVEFMPEGMEKRKKNQSGWNAQTQTMHLTAQLMLSDDLVADKEKKVVYHRRLAFSSQADAHPTLASLLPPDHPHQDLVFGLPFYSAQPADDPLPAGARFFPPLSPTSSMLDALRGTSFVEYPTIRVFTRTEWDQKLSRNEVVVLPLSRQDSRASQQKSASHSARESVNFSALSRHGHAPSNPPAAVAAVPHTPSTQPSSTAATGKAPSGLLASGLVDYGSDDDDSADEAVA